jgi:hypothetical protein
MIVPESVVALALLVMGPQQPASAQTVQSSESRSFTGILMDTQNTSCGIEVEKAVPKGTCPASFRTISFGLALQGGKNVKFDEAGNARVIEALRRSKRGAKALFDYWRTGKATTVVRARAVGTLTSDTLNLESIQID